MDLSTSHLGLLAEFLIGGGGRILALKYGAHADDQWTVDEVLERVRGATAQASAPHHGRKTAS